MTMTIETALASAELDRWSYRDDVFIRDTLADAVVYAIEQDQRRVYLWRPLDPPTVEELVRSIADWIGTTVYESGPGDLWAALGTCDGEDSAEWEETDEATAAITALASVLVADAPGEAGWWEVDGEIEITAELLAALGIDHDEVAP